MATSLREGTLVCAGSSDTTARTAGGQGRVGCRQDPNDGLALIKERQGRQPSLVKAAGAGAVGWRGPESGDV